MMARYFNNHIVSETAVLKFTILVPNKLDFYPKIILIHFFKGKLRQDTKLGLAMA